MKLFWFSVLAHAQEGAEHVSEHMAGHHEVVIPVWNIVVQAINLFLLVGLLAFLLRKTVTKYFSDRAADYSDLVDRAENARKAAETNRNEIRSKMDQLEASASQSVNQARKEGENLRVRLIEEAKQLSIKLEQEAQRTVSIEIEKARGELRHELLEKSLSVASEHMCKSLDSNDQKNLQHEFVQKFEVVGG